jgi:hypothetical protein
VDGTPGTAPLTLIRFPGRNAVKQLLVLA